MALQWRYHGVTMVLQWCYNGVTMVVQWWYNGGSDSAQLKESKRFPAASIAC